MGECGYTLVGAKMSVEVREKIARKVFELEKIEIDKEYDILEQFRDCGRDKFPVVITDGGFVGVQLQYLGHGGCSPSKGMTWGEASKWASLLSEISGIPIGEFVVKTVWE